MTDEELRAQAPNCALLYFDGFGAFQKSNGVLRYIGWTIGIGAQYNIISSLVGADFAAREMLRVIEGRDPPAIAHIWSGSSLAH